MIEVKEPSLYLLSSPAIEDSALAPPAWNTDYRKV